MIQQIAMAVAACTNINVPMLDVPYQDSPCRGGKPTKCWRHFRNSLTKRRQRNKAARAMRKMQRH